MLDLLAAFGLAIAIEGILFAACPAFVRKLMLEVIGSPTDALRVAGLLSALVGLGIVWIARNIGMQ